MRALLYTVSSRVASRRSATLTESTYIVAVTTTADEALVELDGVADPVETDNEKPVRTSLVPSRHSSSATAPQLLG